MPGVAFPPVGPLGLSSPPSQVLCSAKTATLPISGRFACRSRPDTLSASLVRVVPYGLMAWARPPDHTRAFWSPGPPFRECDKETEGSPTFPRYPYGCMPRSQTPVVSCALALAHPGLLPSGHWKPSAFPSVPLKDILVSTTIRISELNHAACIFVPSSAIRPLLGVHVDVTTDLLARLSSDGI